MAPLNSEPADPQHRQAQHLPPKSYADAAEEGLTGNGSFDEESIKETPPRGKHTRDGSEPRPLGEILQESEESLPFMSTPSRASSRKGDSGKKSYAEAAIEPPSNTNGDKESKINYGLDGEAGEYQGQGLDETPKSPTRKIHKRVSSRSMNSSTTNGGSKIVYQDHENKNGEHLTSVKPPEGAHTEHRQDPKVKRPVQERKSSRADTVPGRVPGAGWEKSVVHWAPLNVPIQRRLQTVMILIHTLSIGGGLGLFFLLCAIPLLWPIVLPYLIYVLLSNASTSGELSHRSERLRRLSIWSLFASYFPARLHRTRELPATRKYIFGYHPHGIISHGAFAAFGTEALGFSQLFPGITNTLLTLESNFRIPLYRDYALRMGLASVSRESCENLLSKGGPNGEGMGRAITIVVGGARESLDAQPYNLRLVLARRKGFVKLAIRTGADLVPVLAFGENELYDQFDPTAHPRVHKIQLLVKKLFGFTIPLFHARGIFNYDFGMMPYRRPLNIVVGKPIMVHQQSRPDPKYIDELHARYVEELVNIWEDWKDDFAKERESELEIVE